MTRLAFPLLALPLLAPGVRAAPPAVAVKAEAVLTAHCSACHAAGKVKGGFGYALDLDFIRSITVREEVLS